jgi:hypothetical protein
MLVLLSVLLVVYRLRLKVQRCNHQVDELEISSLNALIGYHQKLRFCALKHL